MTSFKAVIVFIAASMFLITFGTATGLALPISAGSSGTYTYAWDLVKERATPKFNPDSTNNNLYFNYETNYQRAYLRANATDGSVEWHFQTDAGSAFADDVTVKANVFFFSSAGGNSVVAEWSTDGSNYNEFYNFVDTSITDEGIAPGFVALSDSGYTGSSDLFVRYTYHRGGGNLQLFYSSPDHTEFVVTGSVNPVPEPATMLLLGSGLIGLAGTRKRFKK